MMISFGKTIESSLLGISKNFQKRVSLEIIFAIFEHLLNIM
jgi:hypothetical protein